MKVRTDVADMLRDGLTNAQIARHARVSHRTIAAARTALGLPNCKGGNKSDPNIEEALRKRSQSTIDGHREWLGGVDGPGNTPVLRIHGVRTTAYRAAWIALHGRPPIGEVKPGCGRPRCVEPSHLDDRPARERNEAAYNALFGGAP